MRSNFISPEERAYRAQKAIRKHRNKKRQRTRLTKDEQRAAGRRVTHDRWAEVICLHQGCDDPTSCFSDTHVSHECHPECIEAVDSWVSV